MIIESPERTVGLLGALVVVGGAIYLFCRWLVTGPRAPDPWSPELETAVEDEHAIPVCPHCLSPQEHNGWFCPQCGSVFGPYCNYLPSVWIFALGDAARGGVERRGPWNILVTTGYILMAFAWLSVLAPVYCLCLFLNRARCRELMETQPPTQRA